MTTYDNHDKSSTGLSISLNVFLDGDASRYNFEDEIKVISYDRYGANLAIFTLGGEYSAPKRFSELYDMKNVSDKAARQWLIDHIDNQSTKEVIEEKRNYDRTWKDFFTDECDNIYSLKEAIKNDIDAPEGAAPVYEEIYITGHSQGDACTVLIPLAAEYKPDRYALENLFYNAPVYAHLEVETKEGNIYDINIHEGLKDAYNYDADKLREIVAKELQDDTTTAAVVATFLEENLPEYPEYIG